MRTMIMTPTTTRLRQSLAPALRRLGRGAFQLALVLALLVSLLQGLRSAREAAVETRDTLLRLGGAAHCALTPAGARTGAVDSLRRIVCRRGA